MFNLDNITNENNEDYNKKWPYFSNHPHWMLIVGGLDQEKQMHYLI